MASTLDLLLGSGPGQRAVVLGAVTMYLYLFVKRPTDAIEAIKNGLKLFARMFTLILAALLLASAIGALIPAETVQQILGDTAGVGGAIVAGVVGGGLPGGPYAVYPIVSGVQAAGAGIAAVLALLIGYGMIGIGRVPYGLVFFDTKTVALRLGIAVPATVMIAAGVYLAV
ncbi:permease [Halorhabdus amylolytica]|uniref:permease n=1 Tax=Halorhabdus amylolytica TaxID=2559573 RepID=UPI0010AA3C12|nr:permease [Halorhabdus amylolytica]